MTSFQIFQYVSGLSAFIPLIIGFANFSKFKSYARWLWVLVFFSLSMDLLSFYVRSKGISTLPYVHQFFFWQVPIIFMVFYYSKTPKRIFLNIAATVAAISLIMMTYFLWEKWSYENMVIEVAWISTLGSAIIAIIYLFARITYSGIEDQLINPSLIIFGLILIYQCSIVSTFAAYASYINDVYMLKLAVYIIFNIFLAVIFFRIPKIE